MSESGEEATRFVLSVFGCAEDVDESARVDGTPARKLRRIAAALLVAEGDFTPGRAGTVRVLIDHAASLDAVGATWSDIRARLARERMHLVVPTRAHGTEGRR